MTLEMVQALLDRVDGLGEDEIDTLLKELID